METSEFVQYLTSRARWEQRALAILVDCVVFQRNVRYYCVTVPRAALRRFWRNLHNPGVGDFDQPAP